MMAAQRGSWSTQDIADKLLEVSARAQEPARLHDGGYALITAQNAQQQSGAASGAGGRRKKRGKQRRPARRPFPLYRDGVSC